MQYLHKMLHILHIYATYAIYAAYVKYAPWHILHILHISCIFAIRAPHDPVKTHSGCGQKYALYDILNANKQFFWGRCIYIRGRCICAIFGIFSLPERDLDVDRRTAVERFALLPAVNSEFFLCKV